MEPFVFRFKKDCLSPRRQRMNELCFYDSSIDMVVIAENQNIRPVIDLTEVEGLETKKADLEKGDDQKDNLMWL